MYDLMPHTWTLEYLELYSQKYLGIPQENGTLEEAARKSVIAKYLQIVRQVLINQMNGKNHVCAINTYALPVIRYPTGIIGWPK